MDTTLLITLSTWLGMLAPSQLLMSLALPFPTCTQKVAEQAA